MIDHLNAIFTAAFYYQTKQSSKKINNSLANTHTMLLKKNWHQRHFDTLGFGSRLADVVAKSMGSWKFIIVQTILVVLWMALNMIAYTKHWDVYPFILLNLVFSTQAAYAAPIIMMAQNRQNERDRAQAQADYQTNIEAKLEIEALTKKLNSIEIDKLDKIIRMLEQMEKQP
jgi:uncharacterized membrane protein